MPRTSARLRAALWSAGVCSRFTLAGLAPRVVLPAVRQLFGVTLIAAFATALLLIPDYTAHAQQSDRAKRLGGKLMCMCGCNQILTQCNHVGCSTSTEMLKKMDALVARNEPDDLTLQSFTQEYGTAVLAEPPAKGFNLVAWTIPAVSFAIGLAIVLVVISHWRRRGATVPAGPGVSDVSPDLLARTRAQAARDTDE